jgi:hypothetical protein
MLSFAVSGRNKVSVVVLVVISVSVLVLVSWHSGVFQEVDLHSQTEVVKQFFHGPETITEEVATSKFIAPDAVRIYIGIVPSLSLN